MPRRKAPTFTPYWEGRRALAGAVDDEPPLDDEVGNPRLPGKATQEDWFARFDGKPIDSVPAYAIDLLLSQKKFYDRFPWPYNFEQMFNLLALIPVPKRIYVSMNVVWRARLFLLAQKAREQISRTSNPAGEISNLYVAMGRLNVAISELSAASMQHLKDWRGPDGCTIHDLGAALHRFQIDNQAGLEVPPSSIELRGRPKSPEANVRSYFAGVFVAAHDGLKPARGQPKFVQLCCIPLGLTHVSPKAVEKAISRKGRQKGT